MHIGNSTLSPIYSKKIKHLHEVIAKVINSGIAALRFGVVHVRNALLKRTRAKIASGTVIALAMTANERHCESAVADAAVSWYIAQSRNKFLRRSIATTQSQ